MYKIELLRTSTVPEFKQLYIWLRDMQSRGHYPRKIEIKEIIEARFWNSPESHCRLNMYMGEWNFMVSVHIREKLYGQRRSYMGCIGQARKSRSGENYLRCTDFPDGDFSLSTWNAILSAIVQVHLEEVSPERSEINSSEYNDFLNNLSSRLTGGVTI